MISNPSSINQGYQPAKPEARLEKASASAAVSDAEMESNSTFASRARRASSAVLDQLSAFKQEGLSLFEPAYSAINIQNIPKLEVFNRVSEEQISDFMAGLTLFHGKGLRQHLFDRERFFNDFHFNSPLANRLFPTKRTKPVANALLIENFNHYASLRLSQFCVLNQALNAFGFRREQGRIGKLPDSVLGAAPPWLRPEGVNDRLLLIQMIESLNLLGNKIAAKELCSAVLKALKEEQYQGRFDALIPYFEKIAQKISKQLLERKSAPIQAPLGINLLTKQQLEYEIKADEHPDPLCYLRFHVSDIDENTLAMRVEVCGGVQKASEGKLKHKLHQFDFKVANAENSVLARKAILQEIAQYADKRKFRIHPNLQKRFDALEQAQTQEQEIKQTAEQCSKSEEKPVFDETAAKAVLLRKQVLSEQITEEEHPETRCHVYFDLTEQIDAFAVTLDVCRGKSLSANGKLLHKSERYDFNVSNTQSAIEARKAVLQEMAKHTDTSTFLLHPNLQKLLASHQLEKTKVSSSLIKPEVKYTKKQSAIEPVDSHPHPEGACPAKFELTADKDNLQQVTIRLCDAECFNKNQPQVHFVERYNFSVKNTQNADEAKQLATHELSKLVYPERILENSSLVKYFSSEQQAVLQQKVKNIRSLYEALCKPEGKNEAIAHYLGKDNLTDEIDECYHTDEYCPAEFDIVEEDINGKRKVTVNVCCGKNTLSSGKPVHNFKRFDFCVDNALTNDIARKVVLHKLKNYIDIKTLVLSPKIHKLLNASYDDLTPKTKPVQMHILEEIRSHQKVSELCNPEQKCSTHISNLKSLDDNTHELTAMACFGYNPFNKSLHSHTLYKLRFKGAKREDLKQAVIDKLALVIPK